ncbi:hypothetical protein [Actinomadura rubrisoli]|uniref:Uncharacterized protein n=1 Tax=Actinomadura rubrisoli TaxID=2530368 RepID=A0A4R5BLX6_9ACTN|nr:hypothetical protein [Actinomadura rubrisoli]TDD86100.1 hypothetical protein E1298_17820 [Actinomadura rubrisoli]
MLLFVQTGPGQTAHIGTAKALEYGYGHTLDISDRFNYQINIVKYWSERLASIDVLAQVTGLSTCAGECKPDGSTPIRPGGFRNQVLNIGESYYRALYVGGIGHATPQWEWQVIYPFARPSKPVPSEGPATRCDVVFDTDGNDLGDPEGGIRRQPIIPGCVYPAITPVIEYSKSDIRADVARHIEAAQDSGLPGEPGGKPLTRLQDRAKKRQNGDTACPPRWARPTTPTVKSCDEYPFRSSHQGASTQQPQGTGRTFAPPNTSWCEMDPAWGVPTGVTGPSGWSSCMLEATQNTGAGRDLGSFYARNRVLDGDDFFVRIVP